MRSIRENLHLYSYGPRVGPDFAVKGMVLCKPALTSGTHRKFGGLQGYLHFRPTGYKLGACPNSLMFNNSLERLTELRKALSLPLMFYYGKMIQIRRDRWG